MLFAAIVPAWVAGLFNGICYLALGVEAHAWLCVMCLGWVLFLLELDEGGWI